MKIKVGNKVYDGENEPVMVILSPKEKEQIANMGDSKKYCVYPGEKKWIENDYKEIKRWMSEV